MSNLIDRQAAIDRIDEALKRVFKEPCGEAILAKLPSAQPERKKGKWLWRTSDIYECSECGHRTHVDECMEEPMYDWCPYCGARMGGLR